MLLAIDTATRQVSMALHDGQAILAEETWRSKDHHTVELTPALLAMLNRVGVTPTALIALAVAQGPGSYTGLRIGMSLAKGLALAADPPLPIVAIPTLDIVAAAQPHYADRLCVVSQAGRGRINVCFYTWQGEWQAAGKPFVSTWAALCEHLEGTVQVAGEIDVEGRARLAALGERALVASAALGLRRAGFLAELALRRLAAGDFTDAASVAPLYVS